MKKTFIILVVLFSNNLFSQSLISGKVINIENRKPIEFSNVFLKHHQNIGVATNSLGEFQLFIPNEYLPTDTLVITSIGFNSLFTPLIKITDKEKDSLELKLKPKNYIISEVHIFAPSDIAKNMVKKAIEEKRTNYNPKRHILNAYFRDLYFDINDSLYKSMIEADITILDQGIQKKMSKNRIIINQMRKSDDLRHPFFKSRFSKILNRNNSTLYNSYNSNLLKFEKGYGWFDNFFFENYNFYIINQYVEEGDTINVVGFNAKKTNNFSNQIGIIHIVKGSNAILSIEYEYEMLKNKIKNRRYLSFKKAEDGYYYPKIMLLEDFGFSQYLYTYNISTNKDDFKNVTNKAAKRFAKNIYDINYEYNADFWHNYNVPKLIPMSQKVIIDLERLRSLKEQYNKPQ